ncbi:hypothetical protein [Lewinella sp. 4G2]|nr:hypothetical protein [Lewinella sp. 4G2]
MEAILGLLSPEQVDLILDTYDSLETWYNQVIITIGDTIDSIVIEDVLL